MGGKSTAGMSASEAMMRSRMPRANDSFHDSHGYTPLWQVSTSCQRGQQVHNSTYRSSFATSVSRTSSPGAPTARRVDEVEATFAPPACLLACAARPRLVPVRGARISRLLPAFVRRRRPRHVDVPFRTGGFVPGCLRSAPRPGPFGKGVRLRSALASRCSRQDRARCPQRRGTCPGCSASFSF